MALQSYQDGEPTRYYAVCVNSLPFRRFDFTYDVVIIDESEQVFRHVTSDIVNDVPGGQARCFAEMKHHIAEAKSVIVLDADMSLITTQVLKILRRTDWDQQCRIIYNKPLAVEGHREVLMFTTEGQLIHDLMRSLRAGQRCFVASNSKKRVQELSVMIREEFGETRRRLVITSEESQTPRIREFLSDVCNQILEYDVLMVSPAMGTGVDISFENDECRIDCVYGFFEPFINTHTDIDQQLARVRNPGSVKVWFKPGRFDFETSIDTIRDDLARAGVATKAVEWLGNGELKYDKNDPLVEIWTHVTCARRSSMKNIRRSSMKNIERLFIGLREANGWSVAKAEHDEASTQSGKAALEDAEQIRNAEHVERVMKAPLIDRQGFLDIKTRKNKGQLTLPERAALEKYELERAFGLSLTEDIVRRNLDGRLRERVEIFADLGSIGMFRLNKNRAEECSVEGTVVRWPKTNPRTLVLAAAILCGVVDETGIRSDHVVDQTNLHGFVRFCSYNSTIIEVIMGNAVRGDLANKAVSQLNCFLKRAGLKLWPFETKKVGSKKVRFYRFNQDEFQFMNMLALNLRRHDDEEDDDDPFRLTFPLRYKSM